MWITSVNVFTVAIESHSLILADSHFSAGESRLLPWSQGRLWTSLGNTILFGKVFCFFNFKHTLKCRHLPADSSGCFPCSAEVWRHERELMCLMNHGDCWALPFFLWIPSCALILQDVQSDGRWASDNVLLPTIKNSFLVKTKLWNSRIKKTVKKRCTVKEAKTWRRQALEMITGTLELESLTNPKTL